VLRHILHLDFAAADLAAFVIVVNPLLKHFMDSFRRGEKHEAVLLPLAMHLAPEDPHLLYRAEFEEVALHLVVLERIF